jgi:L-cysteine:1D-myo-inositol 2-amino-2-deoxy-alpha-D-glucopyranoside ligase
MRAWPAPAVPSLPGRGLPLRVRDSATGELRPTTTGATARLYVCGITPYDATHMGHAATYVAFDLLQRVWRDGGHDVHYVQNITDVDDPLLVRAQETGEDWRALADREIELFRADMAALRVLPPRDYVAVTEVIAGVAAFVHRLRERGAAYEVDGDLYFPVSADPRFGGVSGLTTEEMIEAFAEHGGDPGRPGKKDALDSLLWQAARPGEPAWDGPAGRGRPGWHVECAAIALDRLGMAFDVQGGGADLAFPHHEMCAAQAHAATGQWPFARAYVHTGMVGLDGARMSKSQGNLVLVSRLREAGGDPMALRLALLAHHYRDEWDWTQDGVDAAAARLGRWRAAVALPAGPSADSALAEVRRHLADDLDAPRALRVIDRWCESARLGRGSDPAAPGVVRAIADALLGVALGPARDRP